MDLWLETIGVFAIAALGMLLGHIASRCGPFSRTAALVITFLLVGLVLAGRFPEMVYRWPELYPLAAGRVRFVLLVFAVTLGLSAPLAQLTRPSSRMATCVIMALYISALTILPFLAPAAVQNQLASLITQFDADGVCRQTQPFTCGPAAAVTGLRQLGFDADEGTLAVASRTSPLVGTSAWTLFLAVRNQYEPQGLLCSFGMFDTLDAIPRDAVMLAVMHDSAFSDHCVVVIDITDKNVVIADPAEGLLRIPAADFLRAWRNCGVILRKPVTQTAAIERTPTGSPARTYRSRSPLLHPSQSQTPSHEIRPR